MEMNKVIVGQNVMNAYSLAFFPMVTFYWKGSWPCQNLAINTLANTMDAHFSRIQFIQFTSADVLGTQIYSPKNEQFSVKGPYLPTSF